MLRTLVALPFLLPIASDAQFAPIDSATLSSFEWRAIGPVNMGGRITDIEALPASPKTFYVATATGGIWKTVNAGTTFFPLFQREKVISMGDIAIAPSNPSIVWAGTGEEDSRNSASPGGGVYKSTDGGLTWTFMGLEKTQHIGRIVIHPTNPEIVYVAALGALWTSNPERGLYKTTDGGRSWTNVRFISERAGFVDIAMDPRNPDVLYAASWERLRKPYALMSGGPGSGLWKSTNGGRTWTEIEGGGFPETTKGRIGLAIAPSNPDIVYAQVEADSVRGATPQRLLSGLYRSADGGRTWKWMNMDNNRPFYFSQIRVDPRNPNRVYRMAVAFHFSDDGGASWRSGGLGLHEDTHAMWIDPNDPEHYILAGDAGIYQTWDRGGTYDVLNQMPIAQFYGVSYDFAVPYRVCGGMQDNGTSCGPSRKRSDLLTTDWFALAAADGFRTAQDPTDPDVIYYETQGGNMSRRDLRTGASTNIRPRTVQIGTFGRQIQQVAADTSIPAAERQARVTEIRTRMAAELGNPNVATRWNWNTPFILSHHDPHVFYSGAEKVFKSVKRGEEPFAISPDLSAQTPDHLRRSTGFDAEGNPASDVSGGITNDVVWLAELNTTVTTIGESPVRPGLLYAGTGDGNVWLTRNDGAAWEKLTGRFPGVPPLTYVSHVEPSRFDSATVYVSFDGHHENDFAPYLYVSTDFGRTFRSIASGLPADRLAFVRVVREDPYNRNLLYVGTDVGVFVSIDRGAHWQPLMNNLPTVPVYDLKVHPRDRELIAGTHGRGIWILDVAPLQQMGDSVLRRAAHLFAPTIAYQYAEPPAGSDLRGNRGWRGDGGPYGATISFRLAAPAAASIAISNAAGDTVRRFAVTGVAGVNAVQWNFQQGGAQTVTAGRGGGRGAVPGFPAGFNPRPAESAAPPDSSRNPVVTIAAGGRGGARAGGAGGRGGAGGGGRGGGGGGGGGGGRGAGGGRGGGDGGRGGGAPTGLAPTGDYLVTLTVGEQTMRQVLRVERLDNAGPSVVVGLPAAIR